MEITVGSILDGNVKSITKFGAFVVLPGGRSGLVHISEISHSYVNDVSDHLKEGQEVRIKIVGIDDAGRINLSIKKAMDPPPPQPRQQGSFQNNRRPADGDSRPSYAGGAGRPQSRPAPRSFAPPKEVALPGDFENMMKVFIQNSDSKLSTLRMHEKRSSRRSGHR